MSARTHIAWLVLAATAACAPAAPATPAWSGADTVQTGRLPAATDATPDAAAQAETPQPDAASSEAGDLPVAPQPETVAETAAGPDLPAVADAPVFDQFATGDAATAGDLGVAPFDASVFAELPVPDGGVAPELPDGDVAQPVEDAPPPAETATLDSADGASATDTASVDAPSSDQTAAEAGADADAALDGGTDAAQPKDVGPEIDGGPIADTVGADTPPEVVADTDGTDAATAEVADSAADTGQEVNDVTPAETVQDSQPDSEGDAGSGDATEETSEACIAGSCDDGEPCTQDACQPNGTCSHLTQADGSACVDGTCQLGLCSRNTPQTYGLSCLTLKNTIALAKTGVWWLDPDGPFTPVTPFAAWCDMDGDGGGWTLLVKVASAGSELGYDAPAWTSIATLHPERPRLDHREAKLTSFWSMPFQQLRVGMKSDKQTAWLVATIQASSLFHLLKDDKFVALTVPVSNWLGLLPGAGLQSGCLAVGLNVRPSGSSPFDYARTRIGVVGNDALDCATPDSRLGIGLGGTTCGQSVAVTAGNAAGCLPSGQVVNKPATGYVFAR